MAYTKNATARMKKEAESVFAAQKAAEERKIASVMSQFVASAKTALVRIQDVNSSTKTEVSYDQYSRTVVELSAKVDELFRCAEETGLSDSHEEAQAICRMARAIVADHNQALNKWYLENSLKEEKDTVRSIHKALIQNAEDAASKERLVKDATENLDQLTAKVMAAIEARYDLWIDAQKQAEAVVNILSKIQKPNNREVVSLSQ